jgi:hypothetical protein
MHADLVQVAIDDETSARLQKLGGRKQRFPPWLMKEAIHHYLDAEERYGREKAENLGALAALPAAGWLVWSSRAASLLSGDCPDACRQAWCHRLVLAATGCRMSWQRVSDCRRCHSGPAGLVDLRLRYLQALVARLATAAWPIGPCATVAPIAPCAPGGPCNPVDPCRP